MKPNRAFDCSPIHLLIGILLAWAITCWSGPHRPIVSDQFIQKAPAPNGPPPDPMATQGQWFINVTNAMESPNSWELHDSDDSLCIRGSVVSILWGAGMSSGMTNIAGFSILATVSNAIVAMQPISGASSNSHSELQLPPQPMAAGWMWNARLAVEFAVAEAGPGGPPFVGVVPGMPGLGPPYYYDPQAGNVYTIEALNEDHAAWYCFQAPQPPYPNNPPGAYYVPAYSLGDIPPGGTAQVLMHFRVKAYGGGPAEMPFSDLRHGVLRHSLMNGSDVLYNRSDSLKISHWIDIVLVDIGSSIISIPYPGQEPVEYIYASDASVFFNSAGPADRPVLKITPLLTAGSLSALQLDWTAYDVAPCILQYRDTLDSGSWMFVPLNLALPPVIPGPMTTLDTGSAPFPPLSSNRFYRLLVP